MSRPWLHNTSAHCRHCDLEWEGDDAREDARKHYDETGHSMDIDYFYTNIWPAKNVGKKKRDA